MKHTTISLLLGIALLVTLFMAFKMDSPKKEYALLTPGTSNWLLYVGNEKIKIPSVGNFETNQVVILNNLANDGWELKTVAVSNTNMFEFFLERVK